jgi:uncharacterized protein
MARKYLELALTPSVAAAQKHYFGRTYPPTHSDPLPPDPLGPDEIGFIQSRDSFFLATVNEDGWPYVQHKGGKTGFLRLFDPETLAFADYKGNRQLLSTGNLATNDRVSLFLIDYPQQARLKIFGHAVVKDARSNPDLVKKLSDPDTGKIVERIFLIKVVSFDWNCPKFITPRFTAAEIEEYAGPLKARIAELEKQLAELRRPADSGHAAV